MPHKDPVARREYRKKYYAGKGKAKIDAGNKRWAAENPDKTRAIQKAWYERFGKDWHRQRNREGKYGVLPRPEPTHCECCGTPFAATTKGSCVDHDHVTGEFRGWLCQGCNCALGFAKDSRDRLQHLINYLDKIELLK